MSIPLFGHGLFFTDKHNFFWLFFLMATGLPSRGSLPYSVFRILVANQGRFSFVHVFMFSCFHVFFVHDRHDLGRDTGVGMGFFQELVDVDAIRFLSLLLEEIPVSGDGFVSRPCR